MVPSSYFGAASPTEDVACLCCGLGRSLMVCGTGLPDATPHAAAHWAARRLPFGVVAAIMRSIATVMRCMA